MRPSILTLAISHFSYFSPRRLQPPADDRRRCTAWWRTSRAACCRASRSSRRRRTDASSPPASPTQVGRYAFGALPAAPRQARPFSSKASRQSIVDVAVTADADTAGADATVCRLAPKSETVEVRGDGSGRRRPPPSPPHRVPPPPPPPGRETDAGARQGFRLRAGESRQARPIRSGRSDRGRVGQRPRPVRGRRRAADRRRHDHRSRGRTEPRRAPFVSHERAMPSA